MGWRGEDRVTGVKNDSAVLRVSGKKMSGEKAISMIQGKDSKWYPLSRWACGGSGQMGTPDQVCAALTVETVFTPLRTLALMSQKSQKKEFEGLKSFMYSCI